MGASPHPEMEVRKTELAAALAGSDLRIATAESCTGGQLAALLAGDPGLGPHLDRGFVVYSAQSKTEMLGVSPTDVVRCEAVNAEVAEGLATGALERSGADIAIAVTGFCGPQQKDEEVGLVYLACASGRTGLAQQTCHFGDLGRERVLDHAVMAALALVTSAARACRTETALPR